MNPIYQKNQIAHSFSKAARTYDIAAVLQKYVGNLLFAKLLEHSQMNPECILDIGSGTGYFTQKIAQYFQKTHVKGVDIASGMVEFAKQYHSELNVSYICADADLLYQSLEKYRADVIFSNLMLQWSPNALNTFRVFKKLLKPKGYLFFSILTTNTLFELKEAWKTIDDSPHVHSFLLKEEIIFFLKGSGFRILYIEEEEKRFFYDDIKDLFLNLKEIGAHNLQNTRLKGLFGKKQFSQLIAAYEKFRNHAGKLPATYEIVYGVAACLQ